MRLDRLCAKIETVFLAEYSGVATGLLDFVHKSTRIFILGLWVSVNDMKLSGRDLSRLALDFLRYVNSFGDQFREANRGGDTV